MIGVLDCTCHDHPLLKREFVNPIVHVIQKTGYPTVILPLSTKEMPEGLDGVILTGTALMDDHFCTIGLPEWLVQWNGPVLGICAGMQLIALSFGGTITPSEVIGMNEIVVTGKDQIFAERERFSAWELHKSGICTSDNMMVLARSPSGIQMIRRSDRPWYGVLFHPEVRNEWLITNFLTLYIGNKISSI
jgi:GMP synthase (glutamine-hydrolysing)